VKVERASKLDLSTPHLKYPFYTMSGCTASNRINSVPNVIKIVLLTKAKWVVFFRRKKGLCAIDQEIFL